MGPTEEARLQIMQSRLFGSPPDPVRPTPLTPASTEAHNSYIPYNPSASEYSMTSDMVAKRELQSMLNNMRFTAQQPTPSLKGTLRPRDGRTQANTAWLREFEDRISMDQCLYDT